MLSKLKDKSKLPKVFKKKWVAALRSGKFKQGSGQLKEIIHPYNYQTGKKEPKKTLYCCLGVACIVAGLKDKDLRSYGTIRSFVAKKGNIPSIITGDTNENRIVEKLTTMNDSIGRNHRSFKRIATWIEKHL